MADARARWRLVLGRFAEAELGGALGDGQDAARDLVLEGLYGRVYGERGLRGGQGASAFVVPTWVAELRELFPEDVCRTITGHALHRFGLKELVTDPEVLSSLTADYDLMMTVLSFKGLMSGPALDAAREVVRQVVEVLCRQLETEVREGTRALSVRKQPTRIGRACDLDLALTVKRSLRHVDPESRRLAGVEPWFRPRSHRGVPWDVVIAVDCSGSMADSVVHATVLATILARTSFVNVRLGVFDTSLVDLSDHLDDPVGLLMNVQLGGGTDIAGALGWCVGQVKRPSRTIVAVITDFMEGGSEAALLAHVRGLCGSGVRVWGLAALDQKGQPVFDKRLAGRVADAGAEVGVVTPRRFCEWITSAMS